MTSHAATLAAPASHTLPRDERVLKVRAASFPRRFVAVVIDTVLVVGTALGVLALLALALRLELPNVKELGPDLLVAGVLDRNPMAVGAVGLLFGLGALYHVYLAGVAGQTLGLRLMGLRIISVRGTLPGPARGFLRYLALCLAVLPAGLGWLWCLFDRERRALHDHLAGTFVIFDQ
ncbi:MAG: RDD family protein [Myxococcales bacterium]|nr:RDD family protein [Myxococcales bacterium]